MENQKKTKKGLSGSTLKLLAAAAMLLDHAACVLIYQNVLAKEPAFLQDLTSATEEFHNWYTVYLVFRLIGRIAFPIFCFLLVEGFLHTKSRSKYLLRLAVFAVLSEIPFDLAIYGEIFYVNHQNVLFTLLIGILTLSGMCYFEGKPGEPKQPKQIVGQLLSFAFGFLAATLLRTDYGGTGIALIAVLYYFRDNRAMQALLGCILCSYNPTAMLAFIPIYRYNGNRGLRLKYFFYVFYPLHLLLLYGIGLLFS